MDDYYNELVDLMVPKMETPEQIEGYPRIKCEDEISEFDENNYNFLRKRSEKLKSESEQAHNAVATFRLKTSTWRTGNKKTIRNFFLSFAFEHMDERVEC